MVQTLRAAVARACPSDLGALREDLVQTAVVRVLEHEGRDEQNRVRTASYLWRVAFTVIGTSPAARSRESRKLAACVAYATPRLLAAARSGIP